MRRKGIKNDIGKIEWDLLPIAETEDVIRVLMHGAKKYSSFNWQNVVSEKDGQDRYYNAALRHIFAWRKGRKIDESGLPALAHAGCCLLFLAWYDKNRNVK